MDLGFVSHSARTQSEALDGPVEIFFPLGPAQREPLPQRGLVDLDHSRTGPSKVQHLIADRQRNLTSRRTSLDVAAHKRPVDDCDRPAEHALHYSFGRQLT